MKASKKCLAEAIHNYEKDETKAKRSLSTWKNVEIKIYPLTVVMTVECYEAYFSSLILYKTIIQ